MQLQSIQLRNFRTYSDLTVEFPTRLTFLTGKNASGKTNLIEAVAMLSHGKSFRGGLDQDLIKYGANDWYIKGIFKRQGARNQIELGCEKEGSDLRRKIKLNDKVMTSRSSLVGQFLSVVFSPSDLQIVEGGPAERRRFLDVTISSLDSAYLKNLIYYQRTLKQRNTVLKRIRERKSRQEDLIVWDQQLCDYATKIWERRQVFVEAFQESFFSSLSQISGSKDSISLRLVAQHLEGMKEQLSKNLQRDVRVGFTTAGPHRDSLHFEYENKDIIHSGSQGQRRSVVLALRIAQFRYLKKNLGVTPVLLIDDVIRELDSLRRSAFVRLLEESGQAIFTTPDLDGLDRDMRGLIDPSVVFEVSRGGILERKTV